MCCQLPATKLCAEQPPHAPAALRLLCCRCAPWNASQCFKSAMLLEDTAAAIYARAPTAGSFYLARNVTQYCLTVSCQLMHAGGWATAWRGPAAAGD